ncbi:MAG: DUF305 domain-containing protein [bacterium]|nr:DUF305 domain-containing protein [bacterium]
MNKLSVPLTLSLMIVSLVIGLAGGYYLSPSYQQTMYEKEEMGFGQADRFVDLRYINQMATHHKGAILLSNQIAEKTERDELKELAIAIQAGEPKLIEELYGWKKDWYKDARTVPDPKVANLGTPDEKVDLRFLNALIAHHEAGIVMTREIRTKSSRKEILDNADAVETFLTGSITTLKKWREQWFNVT